MRRYTPAEVRTKLADALDQVEAGSPVVIERRGVRFQIVRVPDRRPKQKTARLLEILDPAVERGEWTWRPGKPGWRFSVPNRARRAR
jgi:antitoxin (DNA-binding transcriptional repressor) of toxin-antitoxin stability system